jgi:hypothetical protein
MKRHATDQTGPSEKRMRSCYSCSPRESNRFHHYFWIDDPAFDQIWVNVNLARICEICVVPREHVVEFRAMTPQASAVFWKQITDAVKRLVDEYGAKDVAMEVSYGSWITHFHAHVHILASNMPEVLSLLRQKSQFTCDVRNLQVKKIYPGDPNVKLPFAPRISSNNWAKFPLFRLCKDWFGALEGFVVRVEVTPVLAEERKEDGEEHKEEEEKEDGGREPDGAKKSAGETEYFNCTYWIRTDKKEQTLFNQLVRTPPKGLQM